MCRTLILALGVLSTFGVKTTDYSQLSNQQLVEKYVETIYLCNDEDTVTEHHWALGYTVGMLVNPAPCIYTDTYTMNKTDFLNWTYTMIDMLEDGKNEEFRKWMINDMKMTKFMDDLTKNLINK